MKSIKRFAKRSLSIVLCLAMVMTTMIFFDIGITKPEAKVTSTATQLQDVLFYVPEAIYLRPVSYSWGANSKSKFHFFVENTVMDGSGNLLSQPSAKADITTGNGKVYFKYANGTYKNLEIRWLTTDLLSTYSDGGDLIFGASGGDCQQAGGVWAEISREMESPTLSAGTDGCVLEWKLTYHDNVDNLDKAIVAYTYVYKPYVVQISTGTKSKETYYDDHEVQFISWISGIHNVVSEATWNQRYARYGASANTGNKGFMPFLTSGNLDGINGSGAVGSRFEVKDRDGNGASLASGAKALNAYFASSNTSYDYFYADQSANYNNQNAWDWHVDSGSQSMSTTESSTSSVNKAVHVYSDIERDPGGTDDACVWKSFVNNAVGGIYIDTSRYKDLSQVPNLGVGLRITKSEGTGEDGSWYVGDYTGRTPSSDDYYGSNQDATWNSYFENIWTDVNYAIAGAGSKSTTTVHGSWCETKYAGTWARSLTKNTDGSYAAEALYKIRSTVYSHRGEDATIASAIMQMKAFQYDKTNLRTAVNNAMHEFARLGIYDNSYNSRYYNNTGAYTAFINAYKAAYASLIYVNMAPSEAPDTLANKLNTALANLKADVGGTGTCRKTGTAVQYNVGYIKNTNDTENGYRIIKIAQATHPSKTYNYGDKIVFEPELYEGYSYRGYVNLGDTTIGVDSMLQERLLTELPSFSDSDAQYAHKIVTDSDTCQTTITKDTSMVTESSKRADFNTANGTATFKTALNSNIALVYFYEITHADVLLGNEFDFDSYYWTKTNAGSLEVDHFENSLIFTAGNGADNYTQTYSPGVAQPGYLKLIPGRMYQISFDYENLSDAKTPIRVMTFDNPNVPSTTWTTARNHWYIAEAKASGTYTDTFVMTEGCEYLTLRLGIADHEGVAAADKKVKFSNIRIYDVSDIGEVKGYRKITFPDPTIIKEAPGKVVSTLPSMSKDGYQFVGWSTKKLDNGNGDTSATVALPFTVPSLGGNYILYPIWRATDVLFGNEFDFDEYVWEAKKGSSIDVNYSSNSLVLKANDNDSYTALYENCSHQNGAMTLVPGRVYEFSCTAENLTSTAVTASMYLFTFETTDLLDGVIEYEEDYTSTEVSVNGNGTVTLKGSFKIPEGRPIVTIRVGTVTQGAEIRFSDIYIRDVSQLVPYYDLDSSITRPDPIYKTASANGVVNGFPTIERDGYDFLGWYDKNDPSQTIKNEVTLTDENIQLLPKWGDAYGYTIKFDPNGGTGTMADMSMTYDQPMTLTQNAFERPSWAFRGWNTKSDGTGQAYVDEEEVNIVTERNGAVVTLYAQWSLNEVVFGNLFDFDEFTWRRFSQSTGVVDYTTNTIKLVSEGDDSDGELNGETDAYSNDYDTEYQNGVMTLIPGRTYEVSCKVDNLSANSVIADIYLFTFADQELTGGIGVGGTDFTRGFATVAANAQDVTLKNTLKIPEGKPYATIRIGTRSPEATIVFSEICVRDITDFNSELDVDEYVTKANPLSKYDELSGLVTGFPELERTYYAFAGWSTEMNENGNGNVDNKVTEWQFSPEDIGNKHLYPIWTPNVVVVRMHLDDVVVEQEFRYDEEQALEKAQDTSSITVDFYDGEKLRETLFIGTKFDFWSESASDIEKLYSDKQLVTNPGGKELYSKNASEKIYDLYAIWAVAEDSNITAPFIEKENASGEYVLKGWAETNGSTTVKYKVDDKFVPEENMSLYAVWHELNETEDKVKNFEDQYKGEDNVVTVVSGIEIGADGVANAIKKASAAYDTKDFDNAKSEYDAAKNAYENNKNAATNNALLGAIGNVESSAAKVPSSNGSETKYLDNFEIKYAEGVEGKVKEGTYSVADMNLNHYTKEELDKVSTEWGTARTYTTETNQVTINESVVKLATAFANKQDVKTSTPTYKVYDTVESIKESGLIETENITAMNYVYTGKGNYTYYCYTNSTNPTMLLTVDEDKTADGRYCYPTTATSGDVVMTNGATSPMPGIRTTSDSKANGAYDKYLRVGIGTYAEGNATDTSYYYKKSVIELNPDFSNMNKGAHNATVTYTITARDDAYAPTSAEINYADSAKLTSGAKKGEIADIPQGEEAANRDKDGNITKIVTPENTITIIIDYHPGDTMDVTGKQVGDDQWLKQYHLARTSGGASNWELPVPGDSVYTVYDNTYGATDYGSFTYTFNVGAENDIANCVLASADVNDVIATVKENYDAMKAVAFDGAQTIWQWAHDKNDGNLFKYMCTHEAGTGLGFKAWPNTNWNFNYYPASGAYTYVHLVDRWGNTVDKVIQVPNLDGSPVQLHTNTVGEVEVIEEGGSGIETMSFSAQSFEIITDENSSFDGETYTTTGNTVKVYTGEANKKYTLEANDVATNNTKENVTTDAEGYLTITVEDESFDTQSGAYTFSLNGMEINLYAEVEKNVISATGDSVEKGTAATIEVVTTEKVTSVQLVSETGSTTTLGEYVEDEDGNRVWTVSKNKDVGEYTYSIRIRTADGWTTEGNTVTVTVTEPTFFVGAVTNVEYTPSTSTRNEFMFTVTGRPDKIQVIEPDGGTRTYDRYHVNVVIVCYDENGNVVGAMSRELSYEVWTIEMNVPADIELTAIARYGREWSKDAPYKYTVILATPEFDDEVYSMSLATTEGKQGKVAATVVTGLDVVGVRFVMDNNTTATYYTATEADGKLTYNGYAWINHEGENIIIVKIRVNNAWLNAGELNYNAI